MADARPRPPPRPDLGQIETVLTILDTGSVTAAAARLDLSKSVVSTRLAAVEAMLGTALFRRHAGRLTATAAGQRLGARLRPVLADLRAALAGAAEPGGALRGTLRIAAPMSFGTLHLTPVLARFAVAHPGIALALDYDDRRRDLAREGYDLAIRIGAAQDGALTARLLWRDRLVPVAAPALVAARGVPQRAADLGGWPVIGYAHRASGETWRLGGDGAGARAQAVAVDVRHGADNGEAMRDLAIAGLGAAMLPGFIAAPALAAGTLVRLLPGRPGPPLPVQAVWPPVSPMPPALRALVDHLVAAFAGGLPE